MARKARAAPNSSMKYAVIAVALVIRVKKDWMNKLWLAWRNIPVQRLPDFKRSHVYMKLVPVSNIVKQTILNQIGESLR